MNPELEEDSSSSSSDEKTFGDHPLASNLDVAARVTMVPNKAGLKQVDKDHVKKVVYEASKNSRFYKNAERKEGKLKSKIDSLRQRSLALGNVSNSVVDEYVRLADSTRDLSTYFLLVDMDSFYASCEILRQPHLRDVPMAVGGSAMLLTANYPARVYGVRSAMPGFIAVKLCPELVMVKPHYDDYKAASKTAEGVFERYGEVNMLGLDEACIRLPPFPPGTDVKAAVEELAARLRADVTTATGGLTCSVGGAPVKWIAKVASNEHKPNGQLILPPDRDTLVGFARALPCRQVPGRPQSQSKGIGHALESQLVALGFQNLNDLWEGRGLLSKLFKRASFDFLMKRTMALNSSQRGAYVRKSIGHSRTYGSLSSLAEQTDKLRQLTSLVVEKLQRKSLLADQVTVVLKTVNFESFTRQRALGEPTCHLESIWVLAQQILETEPPRHLRLIGVSVRIAHGAMPSGRTAKITDYIADAPTATSVQLHDCPICGEKFRGIDLHVERCLERASRPEKGLSDKPANKPTSAKAGIRSYFQHKN